MPELEERQEKDFQSNSSCSERITGLALDRAKLHFHDGTALGLGLGVTQSSGLPISAGGVGALELALILWSVPFAVGESCIDKAGGPPEHRLGSG
jgi:hypothetical protein